MKLSFSTLGCPEYDVIKLYRLPGGADMMG